MALYRNNPKNAWHKTDGKQHPQRKQGAEHLKWKEESDMSLKLRDGIVLVKVCDTHLLVATRAAWEKCPRIRPLPNLWAGCVGIMKDGRTDADVVRTFSELLGRPEEEISERLAVIFSTLKEEGFLVEEIVA